MTTRKLKQDQLLLRINGTLPDIMTLGNEEKSERAAEIKQHGINTNTSCSFRVLHKYLDKLNGQILLMISEFREFFVIPTMMYTRFIFVIFS